MHIFNAQLFTVYLDNVSDLTFTLFMFYIHFHIQIQIEILAQSCCNNQTSYSLLFIFSL